MTIKTCARCAHVRNPGPSAECAAPQQPPEKVADPRTGFERDNQERWSFCNQQRSAELAAAQKIVSVMDRKAQIPICGPDGAWWEPAEPRALPGVIEGATDAEIEEAIHATDN